MKICKDCGERKPFAEYYRNKGCRDGHLSWCKKCTVKRYRKGVLERAKRDRAYFQKIKVERGCADCGYNAHPVALDFDHLPGSVKRYRVATMAGMRRDLIDAEIAKCEVVCANCHRIRTSQRLEAQNGREQGRPEGPRRRGSRRGAEAIRRSDGEGLFRLGSAAAAQQCLFDGERP